MIYNDILETIGHTPIVRLNRIAPDHTTVYVKVEAFNPMASVKDRLAFAIINDAEQRGVLSPGQTVIEATSGNHLWADRYDRELTDIFTFFFRCDKYAE